MKQAIRVLRLHWLLGSPGENLKGMPLEAAGAQIIANSRNRRPEELSRTNNSGVFPFEEHARISWFNYPLLELEANSQLNLALAEKGAVSAGYAVEPAGATAEVQEWLGRGC